MKRRYTSVDIETKLRSIEQLKNGKTLKDISKKLNVNTNTIKNWISKEDILKEWKNEHDDIKKARKRLRKPDNEHVDIATWIWFKEHREMGCPINGPLIKAQALRFWQLFGENTQTKKFNATQGWLSKWKERHGIRSVILSGEKLSADTESAREYQKQFHKLIEGMSPEQIFNADETGLIYRQLPKTSLVSRSEGKVSDFKLQKERVTVMACSNANATLKLPLMVIGKSAKPRAIKNLNNLPVWYKNQKSAWMISNLFEDWFHNQFVPKVKSFLLARDLPLKAILFIDNCAAHPKNLLDGEIRIEFLPANTTSLIQPMDQGCLQNLKSLYRTRFMSFVLNKLNDENTLPEALKSISIREVIFWIADAWTKVSTSTIVKSWKLLWPEFATLFEKINLYKAHQNKENLQNQKNHEQIDLPDQFYQALKSQENFEVLDLSQVNKWLYEPAILSVDESLTDEEIVQIVQEELETEKEDKENFLSDSDNSKESNQLLNNELLENVQKHLESVIKHVDNNRNYTTEHLLSLYNIQSAMEKEIETTKALNN